MTNEELRQKYRLLKLVVEQDVRTYHALDAAGHIVMVHYLPGHSADSERLLALLDALIPADQMRIVERAEVDGAPVIVTQFSQGFETLPVWLQMKAAQRSRAAAPPASRAPGEFTQMFGAIDSVPSPPPPEPTPAPDPPRPPAASTAAPVQGDFTGMFGPASGAPVATTPPSSPSDAVTAKSPLARPPAEPASKKPSVRWREPSPESERPLVRWKQDASPEAPPLSPPAAAAPPPAPPAPPLPPPPAAVSARPKAPGEMTQLFGPAGGVPAASETPSPTPPREAPPGEFTLLFHDRKPGVAAAPPSEQGPRDYLQALNMPAAPRDAPTPFHPSPPSAPAAPAAPTAAKAPGDFTRLMAGISAPPSPPPAGSAGGSVGVKGAPGGPSDFTRIVAGVPAPPSQPPAQQPAEAAPQPRSPRLFVLLLALGLIGAAGALLVLYFALKP